MKPDLIDRLLSLVPDTRAWITLGMFVLTAYVLNLLAHNPDLADSQLFTALATAIVAGGLIQGVVAFWFGSNKASATKDATIASMAKTAGEQ